MTGSWKDEKSLATYYDTERKTYLGDLFSISWMEENEKVLYLILFTINMIILIVDTKIRLTIYRKVMDGSLKPKTKFIRLKKKTYFPELNLN